MLTPASIRGFSSLACLSLLTSYGAAALEKGERVDFPMCPNGEHATVLSPEPVSSTRYFDVVHPVVAADRYALICGPSEEQATVYIIDSMRGDFGQRPNLPSFAVTHVIEPNDPRKFLIGVVTDRGSRTVVSQRYAIDYLKPKTRPIPLYQLDPDASKNAQAAQAGVQSVCLTSYRQPDYGSARGLLWVEREVPKNRLYYLGTDAKGRLMLRSFES